jgi:CRP-like cAMP-binding protein
MDVLAETIRSIPIFSGLTREDIAKILGKMEEQTFGAGTTVFSQGDEGDAFYVIQSGAVQVVLESASGKSEAVAVLGPQDWFGEMALLSGEPRSATIITVKNTAVWKLSRAAWDELIEKHPTWLLRFCATLSKRLSRVDQQYSTGLDAFNSLAEESYTSRSPEQQQFLRRVSLLRTIEIDTVDQLLQTQGATGLLADLEKGQFPLIRHLEEDRYELHNSFKEFLQNKLLAVEGKEAKQRLHARIAERYERLGDWQEATHHFMQIQDWPSVTRLLVAQKVDSLNGSALFVKNVIEGIPRDQYIMDPHLAHIRATMLVHLGDLVGAVTTYREILTQRSKGVLGIEAITRYLGMADILAQRKDYGQAINCLRSALNLLEQETDTSAGNLIELYRNEKGPLPALPPDT